MQLNLEQLQAVALGAVRVQQEENGVHFYRFTAEQDALYQQEHDGFSGHNRSLATAGVRLRFCTNSETLGLAVLVEARTSRTFFSFDIYVNGKPLGYLDNFEGVTLQGDSQKELPLGRFSKTFALGDGEKEVCIYFPWSVGVCLEALTLDDNASLTPVKPAKKLLAFGDSITQGYDANRPSQRYTAQVADRLGYEEINKGIGGEIFFPSLATLPESFTPDLITVAYGTNDWGLCTEAKLRDYCTAFYTNLRKTYPNTPIVALTPIWRKNHNEIRKFGEFHHVEPTIRECVATIPNVTVLRGYDFVPHDEVYFNDLTLHPNDQGFAFYAEAVYQALATLLGE